MAGRQPGDGPAWPELFASQRGLGFLLMTAIEGADVPRILGIVLVVTLFALLVNAIMMAAERALRPPA